MKAADVMVTKVVTVTPGTGVEEIAETLLGNGISAVPVVDAEGSVLGIVSEGDLIHRKETGTERHRSWWLKLFTANEKLEHEFIKAHGRTAADLMTRPAISVTPDKPLGDIAALLEKHRIKRVPVVDNGKLVGIVSRANLVQALVRVGRTLAAEQPTVEDSALRASLQKQLRGHPWWPGDVNIIVSDGNIELWGMVDSEVEKDAVKVAVEELAGARKIADHLSIRTQLPSGV
jgi:CBS domain-containing protein